MKKRVPATVLAALVACAAHPASANDAKPPAPPTGSVPVEQFFHGKIVSLSGRDIEMVYDFEDVHQLEDFELALPFRALKTIVRSIDGGQLHLTGTGSLRHKAVFEKQVGAS